MAFQFVLRGRKAKKPPSPIPVTVKKAIKKYSNVEQLLLADRLYIPTHLVRVGKLKAAFERYVFKEVMCKNCRIFKSGERYSELCKPCDGFLGYYKTWQEVTIGDEDYYAVPSGDVEYIQEKLGIDLTDYEIIDRRSDVKAKHPLTFTAKLFKKGDLRNGEPAPNQRRTIKQFYKTKRGMIRCPPRFGKTVLATHITCKYGRRLLYVAHERQLLKQFYKTLLNFTDLRDLRKSTGEKICGIIEDDKDWDEEWDIVLCTYQQFIREKGFERLKKHVVGKFGVLIIDECFPAGTPIQTPTGYTKIEDIKVGDKVVSFNHTTCELETKSVISTNKTDQVHQLVKVEHERGEFIVSSNHEIWCVNRNAYIKARELKEDDELCYTSLIESLSRIKSA